MFGSPRKRGADEMEEDGQPWQEYNCSNPKSGKWSIEEENYANELIQQFEAGTLMDCVDGCTLRAYLSKKLNCAPMRISKKFAGQCIGKHSYVRKIFTPEEAQERISNSRSSILSTTCTSSEQDLTIQARRAEVSFKTLAEFQTYNHASGIVQYLHQPIAMMCVQPGGVARPTLLYPMPMSSYYGSASQSWTTTVTQRPTDFDNSAHPVGLDIDDLHQQSGVAVGCGQHGVHISVSTDSSCSSSSSIASIDHLSTTANERFVQVSAGCRTPEVSPNLVSPVQLNIITNYKAAADASLQQPSASVSAARDRCASDAEAEEWHAVLSYFTQPQRKKQHVAGPKPGPGKGLSVCSPGDEVVTKSMPSCKQDPPLLRHDSSFELRHNGSFSSLFL